MSEFGWTRLAYLSVILTVLAILVKLGTFGASSLPEDFPKAALTFSQRDSASEEHLDWGSRAAGDAETTRADGHSEEAHSDDEHLGGGDDHDHSHEPVESLYENVNFEEDPPVFYRPAPRVSGASAEPSSEGKSCETVGDAPPGSEILFPMTREYFDSYEDTWGAARPQGGHEGTDLMAPTGTPLLAMTDARVVPVSGANGNGWNTLGGYTAMLEAAYSVGPVKKGDLFYYAHMDGKSEFRIGDTVKAGDVVGYAGDTGEGPEPTRGNFPPHLHLGWYETSGERTQLASGAMNPYPLLEWVKANGGSIEGGSDIPYCEAPQSSAPTPSGGGYWQFPSDPGTRPDMATGGGTAAPSPVVEPNESSESSPDITRERHRLAKPDRPADPPENTDEIEETTAPEPPGVSFTMPDIGAWIGGIFKPGRPTPPEPPENKNRPNRPVPPPDGAENPEETDEPTTSPSEDAEETVVEDTNTEDTDGEEDANCDSREHTDEEEADEKDTRPDEDCHEETTPEEETNDEEETTSSEETVGEPAEPPTEEQYGTEEPETSETTSGP